MQLLPADYQHLERSAIPPAVADAAGIYRVPSIEGRDLVGRKGAGNFEGLVLPYFWPGDPAVRLERLRLDHPEIEAATGKVKYRYLAPPGARNILYFPPMADDRMLMDPSVALVFTEGEKKTLSLFVHFSQPYQGKNGLRRVPVGLGGVWNWRGTVGIHANAAGQRVSISGVIPDIDRIPWKDAAGNPRQVFILFDANTATNDKVRYARRGLASILAQRGADVWLIDLPSGPGINGVDDWLHAQGPTTTAVNWLETLFQSAYRYNWRDELLKSDKGKILPLVSNVITALEASPEWAGTLAQNALTLEIASTRPAPWGMVEAWRDKDTTELLSWMERHGILAPRAAVEHALQLVAGNHRFHPVRDYLETLQWDGVSRIHDWLTLYCGVAANDLNRAIGAAWLISACARVYQPGCQADHVLILEGPQGAGKSTAIRILAGAFYSDDMPELGTKDASLSVARAWIIELPELEAMGKADVAKIKAFISRQVDRYRPPYGRHIVEAPRGVVFAGTVNHGTKYLKDDTGGRRFWPVPCGKLNLRALERDRDQLWAEALHCYRKGESWWLIEAALIEAATDEQEVRYAADDWEAVIEAWLLSQAEVTTADALEQAVKKEKAFWTRADTMRVAAIYSRLGWEMAGRSPRAAGQQRRRVYRPKP